VVKCAYKPSSGTQPERIEISVELTPDYQKDYEIIPYYKDETENQAAIAAFMAKYITKPFTYLENVIGVEINFSLHFFKLIVAISSVIFNGSSFFSKPKIEGHDSWLLGSLQIKGYLSCGVLQLSYYFGYLAFK
jgi:hypothetical protein